MNSKPDALKYFLPIAMVACFSILLLSWGGQKQTHQQKKEQSINDTLPKNKADKKIRDLDDVLDDLDRAEINVDMDMVNEQLKEAMKQIDMAKIKMDVDKAMKEVDMEKVNEQMKEAMKQVDMAKIKMDIDKAMKDVDMEKINEQMKEAMKQIDMTKLDADLKKLEIEMKGLGPKIEKEMENAKASIEKAKVEMKEYKSFVDGLEKDGLINKKEGYTIQHKNGELIINGKKQPDSIRDKYKSNFKKGNIKIKKERDSEEEEDDDDDTI